jgi:aryl-alcohol dehydrogenase-like predicted oxidoreductase
MSKLILGTVQFGLNYGVNNQKGKPSSFEIKNILDFAFKSKINILDTAEAYGNSHEKIGEYHSKSKNKFKIITKYSNLRNDLPSNIIDRVKNNIEILKIDKLYSYMFHYYKDYISFFNLFKDDLLYLKRSGLIDKIGVSLHNNEEISDVLKNGNIDLIQLPFNLLDNSSQRKEILIKAKQRGIEIHTRSVFLQGLFFQDLNQIKGNLVEIKKELSLIKGMVRDEDMHDLAINYACSKEYIDCVLVGVDSATQLKNNILAIKHNKTKNFNHQVDDIIINNRLLLNPANWNS